jgi:hypothetical protein
MGANDRLDGVVSRFFLGLAFRETDSQPARRRPLEAKHDEKRLRPDVR